MSSRPSSTQEIFIMSLKLSRNNKRPLRERASDSLDSVRVALDSPVRSPPEATDSYPAAVSRLKVLLQQYHDRQSSTNSPPVHHLPVSVQQLPDADELRELISHYYSVVQHLQAQVELLKGALKTLKKKTKVLCEENQSLLTQLKDSAVSKLLKQDEESKNDISHCERNDTGFPDKTGSSSLHFPSKRGDDEEWFGIMDDSTRIKESRHADDQLFLTPIERKFMIKMEGEVDKIRNLHEAKAKHLEMLLFSARDEIEEHLRHIAKLEDKLRNKEAVHIGEHPDQPVLCVKCGQSEAVLASTHEDALKRATEQLKRERDDLVETLSCQNSSISKIRQREIDAYNQVKKSCELAEQAQLEKAEAIIQVQQLKQEVHQQKERYDRFVSNEKERSAKDSETLIMEYQKQLEGLTNKIQELNNEHAATGNSVERLTREKVGLLSELEQAKAQILACSNEVSKENQETLRELTETQVKHSIALQDISTLKSNLNTTNRQREQERMRLRAEMEELRRRLKDAEKGWMESKDECVQLTDKLNAAVREIKMANAACSSLEKTREDEVVTLKQQMHQREQGIVAFMKESDRKHSKAQSEVEQMLESQIKISDLLKDECRKLSQQLESTSKRSKTNMQQADQEIAKTKTELSDVSSKYKTLANQLRLKDKTLIKMKKKITMLENNVQKYVHQIYDLLLKQNSLMKDRQTLSKELEYWKTQTLLSHKKDSVMFEMNTGSNVSIAEKSET